MICFRIDELTPCLKNVETGEIYETEVIELRRKSFLSKFNKRTGWYVNWETLHREYKYMPWLSKEQWISKGWLL